MSECLGGDKNISFWWSEMPNSDSSCRAISSDMLRNFIAHTKQSFVIIKYLSAKVQPRPVIKVGINPSILQFSEMRVAI